MKFAVRRIIHSQHLFLTIGVVDTNLSYEPGRQTSVWHCCDNWGNILLQLFWNPAISSWANGKLWLGGDKVSSQWKKEWHFPSHNWKLAPSTRRGCYLVWDFTVVIMTLKGNQYLWEYCSTHDSKGTKHVFQSSSSHIFLLLFNTVALMPFKAVTVALKMK